MLGDDYKRQRLATFECGVMLTTEAAAKVMALFKRLDTDGSGELEPSDFEALETALCPADAQRITRKNIVMNQIVEALKLNEADTNGDGKVGHVGAWWRAWGRAS